MILSIPLTGQTSRSSAQVKNMLHVFVAGTTAVLLWKM